MFAEGDATHLQAFQGLRFKALADDEFRAAAADINDQARLRIVGQGVGYTQVYQARLFAAVDHVNPGAEYTSGGTRKGTAVLGNTQGVGTYHAYPLRIDTLQQLGETGQAIQAPLYGFVGQLAMLQPGSQLYFFCEGLHRPHFAVLDFRDEEMKGIAAKVDGRQLTAFG